MRVAYFTESLYPLVDGVSRTLGRLFDTLESRGIDFRVFSPFRPPEEIAWSGRVREVGYLRFPPYPDYRVSLPWSGGVAGELRRYQPDLLHVVSPTPMAYRAQGLARRLGVPVVASFHTHFVAYLRFYGMRGLEPFGWSLLRRFYRRCARVYVPSSSLIGELRAHGIGKLELWSRGVDVSGFSPEFRDPSLVASLRGEPPVPILLLVSRLVKEKDLRDLVAADSTLRSRGVPYRLVLVGDGPLREELRRALPDAVFPGHQEGPALARWYASADLFVLPSTTETFGNVVLEALASGLPAVVVDRGGPQDLVADGVTGLVAPAGDPVGLADSLQRLLEDGELRSRMAARARDSAVSRDWNAVNGRLLDSYAEVIGRTDAGRGG